MIPDWAKISTRSRCGYAVVVLILPFKPFGKKPPNETPAAPPVPYTMCRTWLGVRAYAIALAEVAATTLVAV